MSSDLLDEALRLIDESCKAGTPKSVGLLGNVADVLAHFVRDGKLAIDLNEELDNAMVVAGRGEEAKKEEE